MRTRVFLAATASIALAACASAPTVTRSVAKLGDVDMTGLECRRERVIGSNMHRTVCASPEAWAALDEKDQDRSEDILDYVEPEGNGLFGRR